MLKLSLSFFWQFFCSTFLASSANFASKKFGGSFFPQNLHLLSMHFCLLPPWPPYFFLSRQYQHLRQSGGGLRHTSHCPQFLIFFFFFLFLSWSRDGLLSLSNSSECLKNDSGLEGFLYDSGRFWPDCLTHILILAGLHLHFLARSEGEILSSTHSLTTCCLWSDVRPLVRGAVSVGGARVVGSWPFLEELLSLLAPWEPPTAIISPRCSDGLFFFIFLVWDASFSHYI